MLKFRAVFSSFAVFVLMFAAVGVLSGIEAQTVAPDPSLTLVEKLEEATEEAKEASLSAEEKEKLQKLKKEDVTQPEEPEEKEEIFALFDQRPAGELTITNFLAYSVQFSVREGVPANTIILVLLLPFLGTIIAFLRHVVGLPSFDILVPIALSITFVATGISAGLLLLGTIIVASFIGRVVLRPVRIMHLPKVALSLLVVSVFVFVALTAGATGGILQVKQLSIFPVLLLILLSERIMQLQLQRSLRNTFSITAMTLVLGVMGFAFLTWVSLQNFVLLYPEIVLVLIPVNIAIGRYFGLRISEYFRFTPILGKGNK